MLRTLSRLMCTDSSGGKSNHLLKLYASKWRENARSNPGIADEAIEAIDRNKVENEVLDTDNPIVQATILEELDPEAFANSEFHDPDDFKSRWSQAVIRKVLDKNWTIEENDGDFCGYFSTKPPDSDKKVREKRG